MHESGHASDRGTVAPATRAWAVEAVRAACRSGHIDINEVEERLDAIYKARSSTEVYAAIARLPHPPAPLVLDSHDD
jgi:hypothetical protein